MAPKILGITPARGGSKQIPRKNLIGLAGKPLIAWTIEAALASKSLTHYIVSTEDQEIAKTARSLGADVLKRPKELATDQADTLPVLQHALKKFPADVVVLLQCTSPVRNPGLIDRSIELFLDKKADSLATILHDRSYEYGHDMPRRQEIKPRLVDNGNIYVIRANLVAKGDRFGKHLVTLPLSREESVEIDEPFDLWLAEKILMERRPA